MKLAFRCSLLFLVIVSALSASAQNSSTHNPTWWNKYLTLLNQPADSSHGPSSSLSVGTNVDVSNECGPQSETFIAINPVNSTVLAAGSNEIFRLPMRGYFSANNGSSWGGVDLPLPPAIGTNGIDFGSDPSLTFDTQGNTFYSYIVVFFSAGKGKGAINGTEMAVARSTDGGQTYPSVNFFAFNGGSNHFNDKPMITADTNTGSPFRDNIYLAWDSASGGSATGGGVHVATSSDHGATFTSVRADNPSGPGRSIGAVPFVGSDGTVFAAWNDFAANVIAFARSTDGGATWQRPSIVATKTAVFDVAVPAEFSRHALVYPACAADRSSGAHRGRLYCSWMDLTAAGTTDIFLAFSDDKGNTWSQPAPVTDQLSFPVDRFNHWLAVDPVTGDVNVSFYDTRNDTTGFRFQTDTFFTQSKDGGQSFSSPNTRVSTVSSNEHDCNGVFPCVAIDYGNQQGDYEGLASFGGVSHPVWTDSRQQEVPLPGCRTGLAMEEVFTAVVK
ncbi:MAG TPA: sialidase family protein [Candidatus Angelobacter sp.]|nr:sialidase family protein [Candidatus Angelobacter sp.]